MKVKICTNRVHAGYLEPVEPVFIESIDSQSILRRLSGNHIYNDLILSTKKSIFFFRKGKEEETYRSCQSNVFYEKQRNKIHTVLYQEVLKTIFK